MQSIDSAETYAHRKSKDLALKSEKIKFKNIINQYKNLKFKWLQLDSNPLLLT